MRATRVLVRVFFVCAPLLVAGIASGQTASTGSGQAASTGSGQAYPNKPIRIVTLEPGGGLDVAARLIAQGLTLSLGQPVIIDNRGGASGVIAAQIVAKAPADGYTLLYYGNPLWILPFLQSNIPYDPVRDFSPITQATSSPLTLVVNPSLPIQSVKELIAWTKARPGELNYGSAGSGTTNHLAMELLKAMAGVNIVHIPYKGSGPALNDLLGGRVQVMFPTSASVMLHIKSGRLRALAVGSSEPSALAPGLPTLAASGLPGFEVGTNHGVFAPATTPTPIINRLNQEIVRAVHAAETKERLFNSGLEPIGSSPDQFAVKIKSEMTRMGKVIKDANIRAE